MALPPFYRPVGRLLHLSPWRGGKLGTVDIDPGRIDEISQRFPVLPRSRIALALEAYGADSQELERALQALAQAESQRVKRSGQSPLN